MLDSRASFWCRPGQGRMRFKKGHEMLSWRIAGTAGCGLLAVALASTEAAAQRSLFDPAPESPATTAPATAPAPRRAKPAGKPRGPVPARAITIENASQNTLTALEVSGDGKTAKLARQLKPKGRTTLKLPAMKSCIVTVAAAFDSQADAQTSDLDICKDKSVRFTDS